MTLKRLRTTDLEDEADSVFTDGGLHVEVFDQKRIDVRAKRERRHRGEDNKTSASVRRRANTPRDRRTPGRHRWYTLPLPANITKYELRTLNYAHL